MAGSVYQIARLTKKDVVSKVLSGLSFSKAIYLIYCQV